MKLKLIVYDFDGVMTNNKVMIDQHGNEFVTVSRADGLAISEIKKKGISQIILSSEKNSVVKSRADKLNIPCIQGVDNKKEKLIQYTNEKAISLDEVAYVGNDINDIDVMNILDKTFCPFDAHQSIKKYRNLFLKQVVVRAWLEKYLMF